MSPKCNKPIPEPTMRRLPAYYHYLKEQAEHGIDIISCSAIGRDLNLDPTQIRKDLEMADIVGKPKVGYSTADLIHAIEEFLGWNNVNDAFLVGAGSLGTALLGYERFKQFGLDIVAAFDIHPAKIGKSIHNKQILPLEKLPDLAHRMGIHIGILTVPAGCARQVADLMVQGGIRAIWNFAPITLRVPDHVVVQNEDLYYSLAALSCKLSMHLFRELNSAEVDLFNEKGRLDVPREAGGTSETRNPSN